MSRIVTTKLGRFRAVNDNSNSWWLWECSRCHREWLQLSQEQMDGSASVLHELYWEEFGHKHYCGYHETHEFAKELVVTIQTKVFFGENPYEEDVA